MVRYLVVAHETADSPGLQQAVGQIARDDPDASFTLLVPATPVEHLAAWTEGESKSVARKAGEHARALFEADGARVEDVLVGDRNPVYAVEDAFNHDSWDHVLISTLPARMSRWLRKDVVNRLTRDLIVPVTHIAAE
ncbi:MAG: hypothetical protein ACRDWX_06625 [Acidimicrobiia bacterium]